MTVLRVPWLWLQERDIIGSQFIIKEMRLDCNSSKGGGDIQRVDQMTR